MVSAFYGNRQIFEAPFVSPPDILFWYVVTAGEDSISDSCQIDLNILRSDVDDHDLEASASSVKHHSQIILAGQGGLNCKGFRLS